MHNKDKPVLVAIQKFLGVGKIYRLGPSAVQLKVRLIKELKVIIDHFDKYPLITQKRSDFNFLKMVVEKIKKKEHLTLDGLLKCVGMRTSMNRGLSAKLNLAFPDVVPVKRPFVELPQTIDPD